ncbi:MAG: DUF892 family protein [Verrucomicrobiales bacterium]
MIKNLHQLYLHQIEDLHSAESQIIEALPKMISEARDKDLREALEHHLDETRHHLERIDTILGNHDQSADGETCEAIKGIIAEGEHLLSELGGDAVDAGIIAAAQRVEHYEIAAYGTAREYADVLDLDDDVKLLEETLGEEGAANKKLTKLATGGMIGSGVNKEAMAET